MTLYIIAMTFVMCDGKNVMYDQVSQSEVMRERQARKGGVFA
jgi:hypothetical protein